MGRVVSSVRGAALSKIKTTHKKSGFGLSSDPRFNEVARRPRICCNTSRPMVSLLLLKTPVECLNWNNALHRLSRFVSLFRHNPFG